MLKCGLSLVLILNMCLAMPMQPQKIISLKMAKVGMSRICVSGQRIEHVFAHPSSVNSSLQLHESGNLYVSPVGLEGPVFLSIITDAGVTQDLKLEFSDKAPKPTILQPVVERIEIDPQELYRKYLKIFRRGGAPSGFSPYRGVRPQRGARPYRKTRKSCNAWQVNGAELHLTRGVWNAKYMLLEFSGCAAESGKLYPEAFSRTGDAAVILSQARVTAGDNFKVYILKKGGWQR